MAKNNLYDENSIITEDSRTYTRRVPSVYLGSSQFNTNLIFEIFSNSVDEHVIGHGDKITIQIDTDKNFYSVEDNGQGFLVNEGIDEDGETILQRSFDKLNTSGKTTEDGIYNGTALGLNGIGAKLTNWLSKKLHVITYRDGEYEELFFEDGLFEKRNVGKADRSSGTLVEWYPDSQFFTNNMPDVSKLQSHFEMIAALCPKLTIDFTYNGKQKIYHEPGGIDSHVDRKVKNKELFSNRFNFSRTIGKDKLDICITYTSDYGENIDAYVNLGHTESGQHITAFRSAFTRAINKYATDENLLKKNDKNFVNAEIGSGLYVVFNMTTTTAKYDAQNKSRIDDIDAKIINAVIGGDFATWLINNPVDARLIIERALNERKAREAAKKAKEKIRDATIVSKKSIFVDLPSKLSDAYPKNKKDRSKCEMYVCLKGDTPIKLLNGTNPSIESLVGKTDIWAYSTNENGAMIPAKIKRVFKTRDVNKLLKITFSDGSFVECTPNHKFLDRKTCVWVEAKDMFIGQSMFSMKIKDASETDNHKLVFIPGGPNNYMIYTEKDYANRPHKFYRGRWESVHRRVALYLGISKKFDGTYMDVHHVDQNPENNDPSNLEHISPSKHAIKTNEMLYSDPEKMKYENKNFTEESRKRMQNAVYNRTPEGIERQRKAVKQAWKDGKYANATWAQSYNNEKRFVNGLDLTQIAKYIKRAKGIIDSGQELNETNWNNYSKFKPITWNNLFDRGYFESVEDLYEEAINYNLEVTNIEEVYYENKIPVYCLDIDNPFHSFVLGNGIITHNCEGDSAASSINATKDSTFQACFPIRGKILNCMKAPTERVYANAEIANITKALGLDIDETTGKLIYDPDKLRYNKIIFATDADADGSSISSLLLTVFNWLCPELLTHGHIYRVYGALFKVTFKDGSYKLFHNDAEFEKWREQNKNVQYKLSRAKGLGEMTKEETHEQLIDPETRNLKRLYVKDYDKFDKYLTAFQGPDVTPRKVFYETGELPEDEE